MQRRQPRRLDRAARTAAVLMLAVALAPACSTAADGPQDVKRKAFDFAYEDINPSSATHGRMLRLSEIYTESGVVLNFMASWCGPCWKELPDLQAIDADGLARVIGIAADEGGDPGKVVYMVEKTELTFPVLFVPREDAERMEQEYDHPMLPSTYLIDREGSILELLQGQASREKLVERIGTHLGR